MSEVCGRQIGKVDVARYMKKALKCPLREAHFYLEIKPYCILSLPDDKNSYGWTL